MDQDTSTTINMNTMSTTDTKDITSITTSMNNVSINVFPITYYILKANSPPRDLDG